MRTFFGNIIAFLLLTLVSYTVYAQEVDTTKIKNSLLTNSYQTVAKERVTGAVIQISEEDFNQGNINDPLLLIRNRVAGLGIYKKGSNPNERPHSRIRGLSTHSGSSEPLVVIDGVIGALLDNVDPNDIESFTVLKSAAATAIYGMRAAAGVILVSTKKGSINSRLTTSYQSYVAAASLSNVLPSMTPEEFVAAGGNDIGYETNWLDEVAQTGFSQVHNLAVAGGLDQTHYRFAFNSRNVNGVLRNSGFDQVNARASISQVAMKDRLQLNFNMSLTQRESVLSFDEAFRYATVSNPTAPVTFGNGNYWQAILFDNFNPAEIVDKNQRDAKDKLLNYSLSARFEVLDGLSFNSNFAQQSVNQLSGEFNPSTSFFRGLNRGGRATRSIEDIEMTQFESYLSFQPEKSRINLLITGGYSYQEFFIESLSLEMGNLATDALGYYGIDLSGDRVTGDDQSIVIEAEASPHEKVLGYFAQTQITLDEGIDLSATLRRDGSTRLGSNNRWNNYYALGANIDVLNYIKLKPFSKMNLRLDHGLTGMLPYTYGLSQAKFVYDFSMGGRVYQTYLPNEELGAEKKLSTNIGVDLSLLDGRIKITADRFWHFSSDIIIEERVFEEGDYVGARFSNGAAISTKGLDLDIRFDAIQNERLQWSTQLVISSYNSVLEDHERDVITGLAGAPGQGNGAFVRFAVDEEIGLLWGPEFDRIDDDGTPLNKDLNGDGLIEGYPLQHDSPDQKILGYGFPAAELGWSNVLIYRNFDLNMFFRGAFGHSLINTFRFFYEPIDPGAINSYNRVITDKAVDGNTFSTHSSLYVERADFLRLDNLSIGYTFNTDQTEALEKIRLFTTVENALTLTNYTGYDPDPSMLDFGPRDNGNDRSNPPSLIAPGIDRRNFYYSTRTILIGLEANF